MTKTTKKTTVKKAAITSAPKKNKKAEEYTSPIIDEVLKNINPAEAKKVEDEMTNKAQNPISENNKVLILAPSNMPTKRIKFFEGSPCEYLQKLYKENLLETPTVNKQGILCYFKEGELEYMLPVKDISCLNEDLGICLLK